LIKCIYIGWQEEEKRQRWTFQEWSRETGNQTDRGL